MRKFNIKFPRMPVMILPPVKLLNPDEFMEIQKCSIFMRQDQTFKQLKERMFRILSKSFDLKSSNDLRFWKPTANYSKPKAVAQFLKEKMIGGPDTEFQVDDINIPDIEENTGVEFPGI